ncbi:MAG: signal peptide peptidase SppA, partial [Clostridiales bacterium]|nr:signal peptide peptidase SppA [Clostridiales bacterium]
MDDERQNEGQERYTEGPAGADMQGQYAGVPAGAGMQEPYAGNPVEGEVQWQYAGVPEGAGMQGQYAGAGMQEPYTGNPVGAEAQGQYAGVPEGAGMQGQYAPKGKNKGRKAPKQQHRASFPGWATVIITIACTIVAGFVILAVIVLQFAVFDTGTESKAYSGPSGSYIAKVKVAGEIGGAANRYYSSDIAYHHSWTLETIDTLIADDNNKGIYLWINTPGGGVYESDELYLKLMEYKEKTGRPIYVYMEKMATSGGYYVAAAADEIYANRNTWTGSIGVTMGTFFDVSEFLEEHGVHTETITAGSNKAMGGYFDPLTDEQLGIFQGLVDDAYDRFVGIIAAGRDIPESDVRKLADG